ncbi:phosphopantetheine-binding protein [Antrihabitans cavernicola]|uniref:Thioester reductase n=1 Tax=Antrihabitans cavernicola TaxID=2495913 RepID=A0A5A7S600_9NOCA|nr:phosphopantetheine-binding protein [Spelaeibacter cavernicola]KAA0021550.1 thioester reductase [Spelaeibacter cavernicola]
MPISLSQQAALVPERMGRSTPATALFVAIELADVDVSALEQVVAVLLADNEILRTVYPDDRRLPYAKVLPAPTTAVEVVGSDPDLDADAAHRFDLVDEIPIRIRFYPSRSVLSIAVHPVAADDRALDLLVAAITDGTPVAGQFGDFGGAQLKNLAATAANDPALAYWTDRLADLPDLVAAPPLAETRSFRLPTADTAAIVAVIATALRDAGIGNDVVVGLVDPARSAPGAQHVIGPFANQLVLRLDLAATVDPIAAASQAVAKAREHAGTRIERLAHLLKRDSLFQVLISVRAAGRHEIARRIARPHGVAVVFDVVTDADSAVVTVDLPAAFVEHAERLAAGSPAGQYGPALFEAAVPEFDHYAPGQGGEPVTDDERAIAAAIRVVLDLDADDEVGREDTFFSLGGDSIAALRLVTVLADDGHALDVQTVFEYPVIAQLAQQLANTTPEQAPAPSTAAMSASGLDGAALAALGRRFSSK